MKGNRMEMTRESNPLVSIIVPIYSIDEALVKRCINSIIVQSYSNLQIILVDDGNKDYYSAFIKSLTEFDNRIEICSHETNRGLYLSRLSGVSRSRGKYITFVDADDYITIDWIRLLVKKAEMTNADIVMGKTICEDNNHWKYILNSNYSACTNNNILNEKAFELLIHDCGLDFTIHTLWNKLYTRNLWEIAEKDLLYINSHLIMTEDIYFSHVLFYYCKKLVFSNHEGYIYFRNDKSSTINTQDFRKCKKNINDINVVFKTLKTFMINHEIFSKYEEYFQEWRDRYFRWWSNIVTSICSATKKSQANELKSLLLEVFEKNEIHLAEYSDGYFDQKKTAWNPDLEKIKAEICNSSSKVVSFDLFDTLILRPFSNPHDVYRVVINNTDIGSYSPEVILKYRYLSEEFSRINSFTEKPGYEDITLSEIYNAMQTRFSIPKHICDSLQKNEERYEISIARKRNIGHELFYLAIEMNKEVYITSDMYLEESTIQKILKKCGYSGYKKLLLSSKLRTLKTTGSSFKTLIKVANCDPSQILHIGDDWNADYKIPNSLGIRSFFLPKTKDILLNYLGDKYTGNAFGDAIDNENCVVDHSIFFDSFAVRTLCAVSGNIMFDNPFLSINKESNYNGDPYNFGVIALGPHILGICLWLINIAITNNCKTIHFSSRDGYYLKQSFDYINNECGFNLNSNYIYISRKSFIPLEIQTRSDLVNTFDNCIYNTQTPRSIYAKYEKVLHNWDYDVEEQLLNKGFIPDNSFESETQLLDYLHLLSEIYFSEEKANKERINCNNYLKSQIHSSDEIVFDLGYSGKLHKNIVDCLGYNVKGAYISKNGYSTLKRIADNNLCIYSYYDFVPSMQGIVNEYILSSREPSCIGYSDNEQKDPVILEEKIKDPIGDYVITEINRGAYTFVKEYIDQFKDNINLIKLMPLESGLLYEKFLVSPKPFDRAMFDYCLMEDDYFGGIRNRQIIDIWRWQIENRKLIKQSKNYHLDNIYNKNVSDNLEWEVYKKDVINKSIVSKAFYWMCVDREFFKSRLKDYLIH